MSTNSPKKRVSNAINQRRANTCKAAFTFLLHNNADLAYNIYEAVPPALQRRLDRDFPKQEEEAHVPPPAAETSTPEAEETEDD